MSEWMDNWRKVLDQARGRMTPHEVAEYIKSLGEAQLAAHLAAGGEMPKTIREMDAELAAREAGHHEA